jgi:hypothetical protein
MTTVAAPADRRAVVLTPAVRCVAHFTLIVDVVDVNVALPSSHQTLEASEARRQLVAARVAQGVGAAMVSPTARPPRPRRVGRCEWTRH